MMKVTHKRMIWLCKVHIFWPTGPWLCWEKKNYKIVKSFKNYCVLRSLETLFFYSVSSELQLTFIYFMWCQWWSQSEHLVLKNNGGWWLSQMERLCYILGMMMMMMIRTDSGWVLASSDWTNLAAEPGCCCWWGWWGWRGWWIIGISWTVTSLIITQSSSLRSSVTASYSQWLYQEQEKYTEDIIIIRVQVDILYLSLHCYPVVWDLKIRIYVKTMKSREWTKTFFLQCF